MVNYYPWGAQSLAGSSYLYDDLSRRETGGFLVPEPSERRSSSPNPLSYLQEQVGSYYGGITRDSPWVEGFKSLCERF